MDLSGIIILFLPALITRVAGERVVGDTLCSILSNTIYIIVLDKVWLVLALCSFRLESLLIPF